MDNIDYLVKIDYKLNALQEDYKMIKNYQIKSNDTLEIMCDIQRLISYLLYGSDELNIACRALRDKLENE